jgi:putative membrane protein
MTAGDAQGGAMAGSDAGNANDMERFAQQAAMANMAEVELGKLATQRAESAEVKAFANRMIDEHSTALGQLREAAGNQRITLPSQLDEKHQELQQRLSGLQGAEFDREYMEAMVQSHEDTVDLLDDHAGDQMASDDHSRAGTGGDRAPMGTATPDTGASAGSATANLTAWATEALPKVRAHLEQAKSLEQQVEEMPDRGARRNQ